MVFRLGISLAYLGLLNHAPPCPPIIRNGRETMSTPTYESPISQVQRSGHMQPSKAAGKPKTPTKDWRHFVEVAQKSGRHSLPCSGHIPTKWMTQCPN